MIARILVLVVLQLALAAGTAGAGDFEWTYYRGGNLPANVFVAGNEANGETLCIIRIDRGSGLFPGKANIKTKTGYISFDGKEIQIKQYDVFTGTGEWVKARKGLLPAGVIKAGKDLDSRPLYIIRADYKGGKHIGRVDDFGNAYIPWGGEGDPRFRLRGPDPERPEQDGLPLE